MTGSARHKLCYFYSSFWGNRVREAGTDSPQCDFQDTFQRNTKQTNKQNTLVNFLKKKERNLINSLKLLNYNKIASG